MPKFWKCDELTTWLPPGEVWMATARGRRAHILRGSLDAVVENDMAPSADNAVSLCGKPGKYEIFPIGGGNHLLRCARCWDRAGELLALRKAAK